MPIDYSKTSSPEYPSFLQLPMTTRGFALHLRRLVEPVHGWLVARADHLIGDFARLTTGITDDEQAEFVSTAVKALQTDGYLTRCRFLDAPFDDFRLADGRDVPLSHWVEDPSGPRLVITDWVPSVHRFTATETQAWHDLRQERIAQALESAPSTTPQTAEESHAQR